MAVHWVLRSFCSVSLVGVPSAGCHTQHPSSSSGQGGPSLSLPCHWACKGASGYKGSRERTSENRCEVHLRFKGKLRVFLCRIFFLQKLGSSWTFCHKRWDGDSEIKLEQLTELAVRHWTVLMVNETVEASRTDHGIDVLVPFLLFSVGSPTTITAWGQDKTWEPCIH